MSKIDLEAIPLRRGTGYPLPFHLLEVGSYRPAEDRCVYSDIDMMFEPGTPGYLHRDGCALFA